jgi:hypothetical protein
MNLHLITDGHVHVYPFMSIRKVLDSAHRNFFESSEQSAPSNAVGMLFVADPEGVNGFERLAAFGNKLEAEAPSDWSRLSNDSISVVLRRSSGASVVAIRGQQLITSEGLEVLGIGYAPHLKSGETLANTVNQIRRVGGWSILAWGVGKWLGRRGRMVTDFVISESGSPDIMLADNGGRPWCWTRVPQFDVAKERGMRIVAGTDPLPLRGEECRIGSYGFRHQLQCDADESILDAFSRMLRNPENTMQITGPPMRLGSFFSSQLGIRLRPVMP